MDVPAAPESVGFRLVVGVPTSLRVVWDAPLIDNAAKVTFYVVKWRLIDLNSTILGGSASTVMASFSSFREMPGFFLAQRPPSVRFKYTIQNHKTGMAYNVQVRVMGVGQPGMTVPSFEVPRAKAEQLLEGMGGVSLSVLPASSSKSVSLGGVYSVAESSSSLQLTWLPSPNVNGALVSKYVLEWPTNAARSADAQDLGPKHHGHRLWNVPSLVQQCRD